MTHAYAAAQRATLEGRALEREVLLRIAARIEAADTGAPGGVAMLARALDDNRRLWEAFALDLAQPANPYPDSLKAGLISLAAFVTRHTPAVLAGETGADALAEINRNVAAGLGALASQTPAQAAA